MRILLLHNHYVYSGGEDVAVTNERALLTSKGHTVQLHALSNEALRTARARTAAAWQAPYSRGARRRVAGEIERFRPDLVHVHNFFPLLTPSVYDACRAAQVPVVQTLHNYRLCCLNAEFFRDGRTCEACLGKMVPWPGVVHGCYRGSRGTSAVVAAMLVVNRLRRAWSEKVDRFIALTEFARNKFVRAGLPGDKIAVKPNFVHPDPGRGRGQGGYALFVGRLVAGKGLGALLAAWDRLEGGIPLKIVGDGPLAGGIAEAAGRRAGVECLGRCPHGQVLALMRDAWALVFPSLYYENFPTVIAEAYAAGLPIIASDVGSMSSLVAHGRTGLHVRPNDEADLAGKLSWLRTHPEDRARMSDNARLEFERHYSADRNYTLLMEIYSQARAASSSLGAA